MLSAASLHVCRNLEKLRNQNQINQPIIGETGPRTHPLFVIRSTLNDRCADIMLLEALPCCCVTGAAVAPCPLLLPKW